MTRVTLIAFIVLTGFFYVTGKPVEETGAVLNRFADLERQNKLAEIAPTALATGQMASPGTSQSGQIPGDQLPEPVSYQRKIATAAPVLPVRNPRRNRKTAPLYAQADRKAPANAVKTANLPKPKASQLFGEVRHKVTAVSSKSLAAKPLAVSYRQRFVKTTKPVLGPRLTAVLLKRELRRVGCYDGNVTGNWDDRARSAIETFNFNAGTKLPAGTPAVASLERVQQAATIVCTKKPAAKPAIIAKAGSERSVTTSNKKVTKWRTNVQRQNVQAKKTTYLVIPTVADPGYRSVGKIGNADNYDRPQYNRAQQRRITKKRKARRLRKVRVAKRKARRRTAVRSWKRKYRRKRFGFSRSGADFSIGN